MKPTRQEFVEFFSPGTFLSEQTIRPISGRNVQRAVALSKDVTERHGARPYGFQFVTKLVAEPIDDSEGGQLRVEPKEVARSGMHFLGGQLQRYDDIQRTADTRILLSNMKCNGWPIMIENRNSYRSTHPFDVADIIVDVTPCHPAAFVIRRGDDEDLVEYREHALEEWKKEREQNTPLVADVKDAVEPP